MMKGGSRSGKASAVIKASGSKMKASKILKEKKARSSKASPSGGIKRFASGPRLMTKQIKVKGRERKGFEKKAILKKTLKAQGRTLKRQ